MPAWQLAVLLGVGIIVWILPSLIMAGTYAHYHHAQAEQLDQAIGELVEQYRRGYQDAAGDRLTSIAPITRASPDQVLDLAAQLIEAVDRSRDV